MITVGQMDLLWLHNQLPIRLAVAVFGRTQNLMITAHISPLQYKATLLGATKVGRVALAQLLTT